MSPRWILASPFPPCRSKKIPESHRRQVVAYETDQPVGTIIINPTTKLLYYVVGKNKAIRYGIAVGAPGLNGRVRRSSPRRSPGRPGPRRRK